MDKQTIKLDKAEIRDKIASNFGGSAGSHGWAYHLIVEPTGEHRISAIQGKRQWDPWSAEDCVAVLPSPYGDGSSELTELAETMLQDIGQLNEAAERKYDEDTDLVKLAEEYDAERWQAYQDEALDWYANEWIHALNGNTPNDLGIDAPWGTTEIYEPEHDVVINECPFRFEWSD